MEALEEYEVCFGFARSAEWSSLASESVDNTLLEAPRSRRERRVCPGDVYTRFNHILAEVLEGTLTNATCSTDCHWKTRRSRGQTVESGTPDRATKS